ncbi:MAG: ABC transporter ATP-binding protein [Marvinbryantia sp.]|uniref:ABC transporter ATP-binding protein n=1 Tax=Marvinbryantia sp. TaxID=2496532 RepID=UPI0039995F24
MIRFKNLTKRFEDGRGIFDFSFEVEVGEVFGLVGSKGSGKTTALRMLMGFENPTKGRCAINGKDCVRASVYLHKMIGYLPDEITLPAGLTGRQFLRSNAEIRGMRNLENLFNTAKCLELNLDKKIGEMTSADVQKTGIVCALMHNPPVILLDNPFRNLDSKTRSVMVDLILEEKEKGKMVVLTSDNVDIADLTCDRVGLLDKGNIVYLGDVENMRENMYRRYLIQFGSSRSAMQFAKESFEIRSMKDRNLVVSLQGELLPLIRTLANYHVTSIEPVPLSLEETFVHIYGGLHA